MSLADAKRYIQSADRFYFADGSQSHVQRALEFGPDHMTSVEYEALGATIRRRALCAYRSLDGDGFENTHAHSHNGSYWYVLGCNNDTLFQSPQACNTVGKCMSMFPGNARAAKLATEGVERWKHATPEERSTYQAVEARAFDAVARKYRAANPKPAVTDAIRRAAVVAEDDVRAKRYAAAIDAYENALEGAPWWPQGQFNAALLLGQLHYYDEAVDHMKKYLALAPQAPNAHAAQDQIYKWESQASAS